MATSVQVTIDCSDPARLAEFWAAALDYVVQPPPEGHDSWESFLASIGVPEERWNAASAIVDPDRVGPRIFFQRVPEPKTNKNRVHLDVNVGGGRATPDSERRERVHAAVDRLVGLGATEVRRAEEHGDYWIVMQDPEDNEFCLQ